ncbi:major facilitator superfamily domain-containing protein [Melanogaster broomeanus]|nr:major facilitator superfamily domain-containing protein [Melanogaster broomeanus]
MDTQKNEHSGDAEPETYDAIVSRLAQQDKVPWYKKPNLRLLYLIMFPTCIGVEMTSGFDSSMLNGLQAVTSWLDFYNHPRSALLGLMSAMYPLGGIAGLPFVASVTDNFGRRCSILFGSTLMLFGGVLQGAAQNFAMFLIARFILGSGIVFAIVAASSLLGELSHPKERPIMTCLFHSCYYIGTITAAGVTLGTFAMPNNWGWRIPSFLQVVPSLLQVSFIWFLPESPRWLISKERGNELEEGLVYTGDAEAIYHWLLPGPLRPVERNELIGYFLSSILDNIGIHDNWTKNIVNLSNGCWGLVNATFLALTITRFPHRRMYLVCTISLLVVFSAWTVASEEYQRTNSKAWSQAVLALIFLYGPAYNIGFNALTYRKSVPGGAVPFHVRAKGITIFQWWSRAAGFVNQFVNPIGITAGTAGSTTSCEPPIDIDVQTTHVLSAFSYCIWLVFGVAFVYFMFPETSNRTLEELTFLYEDGHRREASRDGGRYSANKGMMTLRPTTWTLEDSE